MSQRELRERPEFSKIRNDHNRDLIRRMRNGEPLTSFDSQSSWFPPRPKIEKDSKAIKQLYGETKKVEEPETKENKEESKIVPLIK